VQTNISIRHGNLSDASQEKLRSKIDKLQRFFDRLTSIEVTVDLTSNEMPRVDLKVSAEHKHDFVAHETADTLWGAVDAVIHKMEQQLRRYKEKVQERHRNPDVRRQEISDTEPRV
jgi:putative sigma-54 modulation protein